MYGGNTKTIAIPIYTVLPYCVIIHVTAIHKTNRDGYRDQIVTCDVGVSLHSKTCKPVKKEGRQVNEKRDI